MKTPRWKRVWASLITAAGFIFAGAIGILIGGAIWQQVMFRQPTLGWQAWVYFTILGLGAAALLYVDSRRANRLKLGPRLQTLLALAASVNLFLTWMTHVHPNVHFRFARGHKVIWPDHCYDFMSRNQTCLIEFDAPRAVVLESVKPELAAHGFEPAKKVPFYFDRLDKAPNGDLPTYWAVFLGSGTYVRTRMNIDEWEYRTDKNPSKTTIEISQPDPLPIWIRQMLPD